MAKSSSALSVPGLKSCTSLTLRRIPPFYFANIVTVRMLMLCVKNIFYGGFCIFDGILILLVCVVVERLSLLNGLTFVPRCGEFIVTESQLFKALFTRLSTKQLLGCI